MKTLETRPPDGPTLSARAKARLEQARGGALFVADWEKVLMIHFAVDATTDKMCRSPVPEHPSFFPARILNDKLSPEP